MPTISVIKEDLERLAGQSYSIPELEKALEVAKAEVKVEGDGLRIQLKDTNRPDLCITDCNYVLSLNPDPAIRGNFERLRDDALADKNGSGK